MKFVSLFKISALSVALITTTAHADRGGLRSYESLSSASSHASEKSWGLPRSEGHKPGKGEGEGHEKGKGKGHEYGHGHGHDDDHPDSP